MYRAIVVFIVFLPCFCLAQVTISGKVLNQADTKPLADASVFLNSTSVGGTTNADGKFVLNNVKPGKYQLKVSIVGFETYNQPINVDNSNISLPDIAIFPKTLMLKEVRIKPKDDPFFSRNFEWFKQEFLGYSLSAKDCTILNPGVLNLDYNDDTKILTASSYDFLQIENNALGYKIKYLLSNFTMDNRDEYSKKIHYKGSVLFEKMKGTPSQERRREKRRQEIYEGSEMHFLRSAVDDKLEQEGFRVLQWSIYRNPERPDDSVIKARIKLFKKLSSQNIRYSDSLSVWMIMSKQPVMIETLLNFPLNKNDIIAQPAGDEGIFTLGCENDLLHITYNKNHHFPKNARISNLDYATNTDVTVLHFNTPTALFDKNGGLVDPDNISFSGAWARNRVAELLPLDYMELEKQNIKDDNTTAGRVVTKLKAFSKQHVAEKAYLHFDKPYYVAGDTIYFKSYVTLGEEHFLTDSSKVLHVDLINTNGKVDQSEILQLTDGMAWGDFALPDSLPKGIYRVRAYTQWMRNDGDEAYFDQPIAIGSVLEGKIPENGTRDATSLKGKPDIQFLPEGGQLVAGIRCKIAFKAIAGNSSGIDVTGVVVDNENKEIAKFSSAHLGMGYLYLTPEQGKTYSAKLSYADGSQNGIDLPKAIESGIVLSVNNDSVPKATVRISANNNWYQQNKNKEYTILIYSGGIATTVTCALDSPVITMDILKRRLHTGIATVTLFSSTGEPLCERLLFIQNYNQLSIAVNSDKITYPKRGKVNINLVVKNRADKPAEGHFSVSVVNEEVVPVDENSSGTILSNLLLTSDLKGYVEQPNYYFNNITDKTLADLDLVMLTHGYRRFDWKQVLNSTYLPPTYQTEHGLEIAGTAKNLMGSPLVKGAVSLISKQNGTFLTTTTDEKGQFWFNNLEFADTTKFILQAVNVKGKNTTKLVYDKYIALGVTPNNNEDARGSFQTAYLENAKYEQLNNTGTKMLKEVRIADTKIKHYPSNGNFIAPEEADQLITSDELEKLGEFKLSGRVLQKFYGRGTAHKLIVMDGISMAPGFDVDNLNPSDIETVGAVYGPNASIYGMRADSGVWLITTKRGKGLELKDIASIGILPIIPKGFYKAREFYSPKYDTPIPVNNRRDLRSTIFWKPELETDKDGNASFNYYNADGTGTYKIVVEGIDNDGNLGRQVYRYTVE